MKSPMVLCVSGFDPSAGAGILADVKTLENLGVYAMGAITANTIQTENTFQSVNWVEEKLFFEQLETLLKSYTFDVVKIGIVPSFSFLDELLNRILFHQENAKVIWDPILSASVGFVFHPNTDIALLKKIAKKTSLITPNFGEAKKLFGEYALEEIRNLKKENSSSAWYVKTVSQNQNVVENILFSDTEKVIHVKKMEKQKHGSGCVLSSAVAAFLCKAYSLEDAVERATDYTSTFLDSSETLLGHHVQTV